VCRTLHTLRLLRAPACARAGRSGCTTRHAHRTHACPFSPAHAQHTPPACPQALETFPTFLAVSLLGGVRHPLFVTAAGTPHKHHRSPFHTHTHTLPFPLIFTPLPGVTWIIGRLRWASCYAEGGASARYNSFWSKYIWYSLIGCAVAATSFALGLAGVV
jgi:hypothetical protein